jgi:hypothetical protein
MALRRRKGRHAARLAAALAAIVVLLSGCADDIDKLYIGYAIGVDLAPGGKVHVSLVGGESQSGTVATSTGGGSGGSGGTELGQTDLDTTSDTLAHALDTLSLQTAGDLYLGSVRLVVIGAPLARHGLEKVAHGFVSRPEFTTHVDVIGSATTAADLLRANYPGGAAGATYVYKNAVDASQFLRSTAPLSMARLYAQAYSPSVVVRLPLYQVRPPGAHSVGLLVGDRMVDVIPRQDAVLALSAGERTAPDWVTLSLYPHEPSAVVYFANLHTKATLDPTTDTAHVVLTGIVHLGGEAPRTHSGGSATESYARVNQALAKRTVEALLPIYAHGVDVLGLGLQLPGARPENLPTPAWQALEKHLRLVVESRVDVEQGGPRAD